MATTAPGDGLERWSRQRLSGPSRSMESMWRDLPLDILEIVVTHLPIASLLRFKTVSKKWNRLISHRNFALRHAQASSPEEYVLIGLRINYIFQRRPRIVGWEVLDMANRRVFKVSADFLMEYLKHEGILPKSPKTTYILDVIAADGGLFCVSCLDGEGRLAILVCNPVLRTAKLLPRFPGRWSEGLQEGAMSTGRLSMEYEVFIINGALHPNEPNAIHVYESNTDGWKNTSSITIPRNFFCHWCWGSVSVFVKNEFYKLFPHRNPFHVGIVSYNKVTGVVSELDVEYLIGESGGKCPFGERGERQLVGSKDRLFLVTIVRPDSPGDEIFLPQDDGRIEIFEIDIARRECTRFAEMPSSMRKWVLSGVPGVSAATIIGIGCANCILICSFTGSCVGCDLSSKSWHHGLLRGHNFLLDPELCRSNYCLSLCVP